MYHYIRKAVLLCVMISVAFMSGTTNAFEFLPAVIEAKEKLLGHIQAVGELPLQEQQETIEETIRPRIDELSRQVEGLIAVIHTIQQEDSDASPELQDEIELLRGVVIELRQALISLLPSGGASIDVCQ